MISKAKTVAQYLAELPKDRRAALEAVRKVILDNLDKGYEEGINYGMIGYSVPHSLFPAGYHCDPSQPLPYAGLASQKNHMSLYLMCLYGHPLHLKWFQEAWAKTGKKLDMGKACIRFKEVDDLALDVLAEAFRRTPAKVYIDFYESTLGAGRDGGGKGGKAAGVKRAMAKAGAKKKAADSAASKGRVAAKLGGRSKRG